MRKREFIRKAGLLSASVLTIPTLAKPIPPGKSQVEKNDPGTGAPMNLVIGSDHAGFHLKVALIKFLQSLNYNVKDVGSFTPEPVDFPDIAVSLSDEILNGRSERGIMVCGTGVGASIACNKIQGIRAALSHDSYSAHQCVEHDNVNVLCMGAQIIGQSIAEEIITNFLNARFSTEEQFRRRVRKVDQFDLVPPKL